MKKKRRRRRMKKRRMKKRKKRKGRRKNQRVEGGRGRNLLPSILPRMSGEVQVIPVYDIYIQQLNKKKLKRGVIVSDSDSEA